MVALPPIRSFAPAFIVAVALLSLSPARASQDGSSTTSSHPLAFGINVGFGGGQDTTLNYTPHFFGGVDKHGSHFDLELPGFELRLYPTDHFSFDFLWQVGNMDWGSKESGAAVLQHGGLLPLPRAPEPTRAEPRASASPWPRS